MRQLRVILTDRDSKYAVSGAPVDSRDAAKVGLKTLKRAKSYAKATHNTWAAVLSDGQILKNDDRQAGAGMVIVRMLQRQQLEDHMIVVMRWFGGTYLGGDRFRHVQSCVRQYIAAPEV